MKLTIFDLHQTLVEAVSIRHVDLPPIVASLALLLLQYIRRKKGRGQMAPVSFFHCTG
jgi:hypothetical protein